MIDAKELKIGNKVDLYGSVATIQREDFNGVGIAVDKGEPIPLTEEWLIKFGFDYLNEYGGWYVSLPGCRRYLIYDIKTKDIYLGNVYRNKLVIIKYVHQLQNLFFSLVGKELTIKDNG